MVVTPTKVLLFSKEETMMNFIEDKKVIIATLTAIGIFAVFSNTANASEKNNLLSTPANETVVATQVALSVSKDTLLDKFENAYHLSEVELKQLLSAVGFKGKALREAWAVAKKESGGRPFAFNGNTETGDSSYGLFQINMIGMLGPDRRDKFKLDHNADLFNPVLNAKIAYHMSNGGEDWTAWKGMTPRTKSWMAKFPG